MESRSTATIHWKRLFGDGGLFVKGTKTGRGLEVGSFVRELRLGGGERYEEGRWEAFQVLPLVLPLCSTLYFDCLRLYKRNCPPLKDILSQLPVSNFFVFHGISNPLCGASFPSHTFTLPLAERLGIDPQPWENLERIVFRGCIWYDVDVNGRMRLSCSALSFETLVVEVPARSPGPNVDYVLTLFLEPKLEKGERFLEDVGRIEVRISGEYANRMEEKFSEDVRKRVARGLSSLERRLLPLFVFVSEDGSERLLIEDDAG